MRRKIGDIRPYTEADAKWLRWDKRFRKVCAYIKVLESGIAPGMEDWRAHTLEYQYAVRDGLILHEPEKPSRFD